VRIQTTIALGKVTAELISAETKAFGPQKPAPPVPLTSSLDGPVLR